MKAPPCFTLAPLLLTALVACTTTVEPKVHEDPIEDTDTDATDDTDTDATDDTDDTDTDEPEAPMLDVDSWTGTSTSQGLLEVPVQVDADTTAFMVSGVSTLWVGLEQVKDPSGQVVLHWSDWWDSPQALTSAIFAYDKATGFNWPVRAQDGPLTPGEWTVELWVSNAQGSYAGNVDVDVTVHRKADPDLTEGVARVAILWADGVGDDPDVVSGVETAVERWRDIWEPMGLQLEVTYQDTPLDPNLGFTYNGSSVVADITSTLPDGRLVLVVGDQIGNESDTYGVSGGIPGTLAASPMTFVVLSWLAHAGQDGTLQPKEVALMGETMAHEMGHYMGLFHPVESDYEWYDALDDTVECTTWYGCESELGDNLMFPYPICDAQGCRSQDQLTPEQQAVSHRYTGTL